MNMITELNRFSTLDALLESLSKALNDKSMFRWNNPEDFSSLYEALVSLSNDNETLHVIATLGRVEAALKRPLLNQRGRSLRYPQKISKNISRLV